MAAKARTSTELLMPNKKHNNYGNKNHGRRISSADQESMSKNIWVDQEAAADEVVKSRRFSTSTNIASKVVEVVYYISAPNGNLQHPHFMEVSLPHSSHGLYLRDVMNKLNILRGDGMANMYSWSSKRSYKNGYVWQDLSENDLIYPTNGKDEYVIKGSELLQLSSTFRSIENAASRNLPETKNSGTETDAPPAPIIKRRNQSWSSFDNPPTPEYKVYKCESSRGFAGVAIGTQTKEKKEENVLEHCKEEISPAASNASSEIFDGTSGSIDVDRDCGSGDRTVKNLRGRMKVSKLLMQFIRCGSVPMKGL